MVPVRTRIGKIRGFLHVLMSLLGHHIHTYAKRIHPTHESKTESKTVAHELIRRNKNGQKYHEFPRYRPIEAVSKPAEKEVLGSSSPPFYTPNLVRGIIS